MGVRIRIPPAAGDTSGAKCFCGNSRVPLPDGHGSETLNEPRALAGTRTFALNRFAGGRGNDVFGRGISDWEPLRGIVPLSLAQPNYAMGFPNFR